jgi:hypothetical protein
LAGAELEFTAYQSDWDAGRIVATASRDGSQWTAIIAIPDLESALEAAAEGLASDVTVGGESVPVRVDEDKVQIPVGPFIVSGTTEEWRRTMERERSEARPLSHCPVSETQSWIGERILFPVTSID